MNEKDRILAQTFTEEFDIQSDEHTFFVFRGTDKNIKVGLSDVLQAISFAEDCREIPSIPMEWWTGMASLYGTDV